MRYQTNSSTLKRLEHINSSDHFPKRLRCRCLLMARHSLSLCSRILLSLASLVSELHPILGPGAGMLENHFGVLKLFTQDVAVEASFSLAAHR